LTNFIQRNIFIAQNDTLKIGDLGFAKSMESLGTTSITKSIIDSLDLCYSAPELFDNQKLEPKSDVW